MPREPTALPQLPQTPWRFSSRVSKAAAIGVLALSLLCTTVALPAPPSEDDITDSDRYAWIYIVGAEGNIIKSSDAGRTWKCSHCGLKRLVTTTLNDVHFHTALVGFVVGDSGVVLKTVNGGANWVQAKLTEATMDLTLYGVHVFRPLIVHVVGELGRVLSTDNGGDTWSEATPVQVHGINGVLFNPTLRSLRFSDSSNGVLVGDANFWWETEDGGETWLATNLSGIPWNAPDTSLRHLSIDQRANMVAVGVGGLLYVVRREMRQENDDAIFLWDKLEAPAARNSGAAESFDLLGSSAIDPSTFAIVGRPTSYVAVTAGDTLDLGSAALTAETLDSESFSSVYLSTRYTLVAASASGKLFRSGDGGNSFAQVSTPPEVSATAWTAMHGRNAADESGAADGSAFASWGLRVAVALLALAPSLRGSGSGC